MRGKGAASTEDDVALLHILAADQHLTVALDPCMGGKIAFGGFFHAQTKLGDDTASRQEKPQK